jgi:hypothetical protein
MRDTERTGEKYTRIAILRTIHQKLKDLAGQDKSPEEYLENIIKEIAEGNPAGIIKPKSIESKIPLVEATEKLDALAKSIQWLTEITLENRRAFETMQAMLTPVQPGHFGNDEHGFKRQDKPGEPQVPRWEESHFNTQFNDKQIFPISPPAEAYESGGGDESRLLEAKIKKYEEDNPW